jgi:PHD/YefM family antitoxin component YafN of YafNO toxin-antitoxin module
MKPIPIKARVPPLRSEENRDSVKLNDNFMFDEAPMIDLEDIQSLTDFQRDAKSHIRKLKRTGKPQVLTVNGRAEVVIQDAKSYQKLLDLIERAEAIAMLRDGLESINRGEGEPAHEVLERIRMKHKIPAAS